MTGTATYRERIALPPGAIFEATLEDVSKAGAPADVIGQTQSENPGQPPFRFSLQYDPARIVQNHSYVVRARISVGGKVMFTTTRSYPVLTRGNGSDVALMMHRAGASSGGSAAVLGALPATFVGKLPCADCPAIQYVLNLFPNQLFFDRMTYTGRGEGKSMDRVGGWRLSEDGLTLVLNRAGAPPDHFAIRRGVLIKVDLHGGEIRSRSAVDLQRTAAFQQLEPHLAMRGMFMYMADAANFTECGSRQRLPVAMEAEYRSLESAYLELRTQPGEQLLTEVEGRIVMRPNMESGLQPRPTVVVERFVGVFPGETCGTPGATEQLQETYWRLTRLDGKPVILSEKQREPSLVFRSEQNRLTGFGGCNRLTGSYHVYGEQFSFRGVASTRMACINGMDIEQAFLAALRKVRKWKIAGQHLDLTDDSGNQMVRFEARALR